MNDPDEFDDIPLSVLNSSGILNERKYVPF